MAAAPRGLETRRETTLTGQSAARVAVIIVNWNAWSECVECLDSLLAQAHGEFHVYIVDNDSKDGSIERIMAWCEAPRSEAQWRRHDGVDRWTDRTAIERVECRVIDRCIDSPLPAPGCRLTLVRSGGNLGFAGGCNVGIAAAGLGNFAYFWFLNADAVVHRRALVDLVARAERDEQVGMVGSTIRYYDTPSIVQAMGGARLDRSNGASRHIGEGCRLTDVPSDGASVERNLTYIMGASMLVTARYIREVGLMAEDYFLYFEDADWGMRGTGRFVFAYAPTSHVFHKWGASSHKAAALFSSRFYYRNRLRFVARFLPGRLPAAKRLLVEQLLRHLLRGRWAQARLVGETLLHARQITSDVIPHEPLHQ